jgi:hypothetical protein
VSGGVTVAGLTVVGRHEYDNGTLPVDRFEVDVLVG